MSKTDIYGIAGVHASEKSQRAALVPGQNFVNYTAMTKGETALVLLAERMNIYKNFYPEVKGFARAHDMLINALYRGVHRLPAPSGLQWTKAEQQAARAIQKAKLQTRPAARNLQLVGRKNAGQGIGDPLVPLLECEHLNQPGGNPYGNQYEPGEIPWQGGPSGGNSQLYLECVIENGHRNTLNQHLETSSAHMLYNFATSNQLTYGAVAAKKVFHATAVDIIVQVTDLDRDLILEWMRTGVMRSMTNEGEEPLQPEYCIESLRANGQTELASIGIEPFIISAIVAVIGILVKAVTEAIMIKNKMPTQGTGAIGWNDIPGYGSESFSASGDDMPPYGGEEEEEEESTNNLLSNPATLLLGAGLLFTINEAQ